MLTGHSRPLPTTSKHLWLSAKALECLRATPDHSRPKASLTAPFPTTPGTLPTTPDHSRPLPTTPDHFRPVPTTSDHFRPHTSDPVFPTPDHEATILLRVWNAYKSHSRPLPKLLTTRGLGLTAKALELTGHYRHSLGLRGLSTPLQAMSNTVVLTRMVSTSAAF